LCSEGSPLSDKLLEERETAEQATREMHLPLREERWAMDGDKRWPMLLSGYQLDSGMKPVVFWHTVDQLCVEITSRLRKIERSREDSVAEILTLDEARQYFLSIGRRHEKVFISSASSQDRLATIISERLQAQCVRTFHYRNVDAIPMGTQDWLQRVRQEIDGSRIFIALMDGSYLEKSEWCREELRHALVRCQEGKIRIFPYILEATEWKQSGLRPIQTKCLLESPQQEWADIVASDIVSYLELPVGESFQTKEE